MNPATFSNWYNISDSVVKNTLAGPGRVFKTQVRKSLNRSREESGVPSKIFGLSVETTNLQPKLITYKPTLPFIRQEEYHGY